MAINTNDYQCKKRNQLLFLFELVSSIFIIFIHCPFPNLLGIFFSSSARFAVPLFFCISGYYFYNDSSSKVEIKNRIKNKLSKLINLLILSLSLYITIKVLTECLLLNEINFIDCFIGLLDYKKIILLLAFNAPIYAIINWFILALIYIYILLYFVPSFFQCNVVSIFLLIAPLFIMLLIYLTNIYKISIFNVKLYNTLFYRNWLSTGLVFFNFGVVIKKKIQQLIKFSNKKLIFVLFISFTLMIVENVCANYFHDIVLDYNLFSFGVVFCLMILSLKNNVILDNSIIKKIPSVMTKYIFIIHLAVVKVMNTFFRFYNLNFEILNWLKPIIAITISLCISFFLCLLHNNSRLKKGVV